MLGLGPAELGIIFLIILVLFGANKLPQIGEGLGKAIGNFKDAMGKENKSEGGHILAKIEDSGLKK